MGVMQDLNLIKLDVFHKCLFTIHKNLPYRMGRGFAIKPISYPGSTDGEGKHVVVVGGGMAGLSAAETLVNAGFRCVYVLEY